MAGYLRERSRGGSSGYPGMMDPVRNPQSAPAPVRTKRAFLLLLLTLVIPGSAQLVAGDRRLGRKALRVTFVLWAVVLLAIVVALLDGPALVSIATNQWGSLLLMAAMVALALFWAFLFLNTLRLIRPRLLAPGMRPILGVSLAALMLATSGSLGYGAYLLNVGRNALGSIFASGPAFAPADGRYNFLLMGGDAGAGRIGLRPDSISVLSVDAKTGHTVTFSIPRNFQNAQFPDDSPMKQVYPQGFNCGDECIINALYMDVTNNHADLYPDAKDPGAEAMKDAASGILGIDIQAYALVDMGGFEKLIDAMGGITIKAGNWVPISNRSIPGTNLHYPPKDWIAPGVQKLDGYHALWYGRSREFATDYDRIQRQQCVQKAMIKQLDPGTVLTRFQALAEAGEQVVESDIPAGQLGSFVSLAAKAKGQEVERLTIGPPDFGTAADNFVTYPDFDQIHQRVQAMFTSAGKTGTESPSGAAPEDRSGLAGGAFSRASAVRPAMVRQEPPITKDYLQQLAEAGDVDTLGALLADNGKCSVP